MPSLDDAHESAVQLLTEIERHAQTARKRMNQSGFGTDADVTADAHQMIEQLSTLAVDLRFLSGWMSARMSDTERGQ